MNNICEHISSTNAALAVPVVLYFFFLGMTAQNMPVPPLS